MLYAWIGFLKAEGEPIPQSVQEQVSDFLGQSFIKIHSAGPLLEASGKRAGMMIFEHDSREAAESFVTESPYLRAGLYKAISSTNISMRLADARGRCVCSRLLEPRSSSLDSASGLEGGPHVA